jgi:hypothetical protein
LRYDRRKTRVRRGLPVLWIACALSACTSTRTFPLREPMWTDSDLASVTIPCRLEPAAHEPRHVTCAPAAVELPEVWTALDHVFLGPLSDALAIPGSREAKNVNSLDEVPDSAWFTNRHGVEPAVLLRGACDPAQLLDPEDAPDGSWIIDKGKTSGATSGFRVSVPSRWGRPWRLRRSSATSGCARACTFRAMSSRARWPARRSGSWCRTCIATRKRPHPSGWASYRTAEAPR